MKVAMIGQKGIPATYGGIERHVEELSAELAARGHAVTVFVRPSYTDASGTHRGVRLRRMPSVATKHLDAITHTTLCTAAVLGERFDIIHYHAVGPALLSWVPRWAGRRVVVTVHAADWQRAKWGTLARWALRCGAYVARRAAHQIIAVSPALKTTFADARAPVTSIGNGVAHVPHRPIARLARFGLQPGRYVLWMGRFTPEKRCEDLVRAFCGLELDAQLVLGGEPGENAAYVKRLRADAAGDGRVVFAGGLYGQDKAEALSNAGLFVLPSELEGMPLALLEAMAAGVPVVGSDIGPVLDVVTPGRTGQVYPVGDVAALRRAMDQAFRDRPRARAMAEAARLSLDRRYDWARIARQTEGVYVAALGSSSPEA